MSQAREVAGTEAAQRAASTSPLSTEERNLTDYIAILWKRRMPIAIITAVSIVGFALVAFSIQPSYQSITTILPITQERNSSLSQYAGLAAMARISLPGRSRYSAKQEDHRDPQEPDAL